MSDEPLCRCGHTAHWHQSSGIGECDYSAECSCKVFTNAERRYRSALEILDEEALEVPADMIQQVYRRIGWDAGQVFIENTLAICRGMLMAIGDRKISDDAFGQICMLASLVATDNYYAELDDDAS